MGSTYRRQDSPYWWIQYSRDGRAFGESSRSRKRADAVRLLRRREGDIERGLPITPKVGRLRFEEAAADIVNDYIINKRRSLDELERRIRLHLLPYFRRRRMAGITTIDVRAFIARRLKTPIVVGSGDDRRTRQVSAGEINRELTTLKRMFSLAIQAGKLLHKPHIPLLKENNVRTGFFERPAFQAIRAHLPENLRGVVTFAYITGWRINSEVFTLQWRQVDETERLSPDQDIPGSVRLDPGTTKNDEGRVFPFTSDLRDVFATQRDVADRLREQGQICPWVFHRNGKPIKSFTKAWRAACLAAGQPGKIPHDFRRTAVRNLVRSGVPEQVAMKLTGHKTRSVFERYNIVSDGDLAVAARKLDAVAGERPLQVGVSVPLTVGTPAGL